VKTAVKHSLKVHLAKMKTEGISKM